MTNDLPELLVLPDADAVADAAAGRIAASLAAAIAARGRADWATTGGSAAPPVYRRLAASPLRETVDWSRVHVWWGDDRFVAWDDALSNARPFDELMLGAGVGILPEHVHRVATPVALAEGHGADWCAAVYADELLAAGPEPDTEGVPVLDLVILGVGPDGHILSVFPDSAVWDRDELAVAVPAPTHIEPHVERVTLHPSLVAAAREVMIVSTGAAKAPAFAKAWAGGDPRDIPTRAARRAGAVWILDAAAAAELPSG